MLVLIHNQRCSKSRAALALVEAGAERLGLPLEVVDYQRDPLSLHELETLRDRLGVPAREMLRDSEEAFVTLGLADPGLSESALLAAIAAHPVLLQRPIVMRGDRAVIARPPERALTLLD